MRIFNFFQKEESKNSSPTFVCHSLTCSFTAKSEAELEKHETEHELSREEENDCE